MHDVGGYVDVSTLLPLFITVVLVSLSLAFLKNTAAKFLTNPNLRFDPEPVQIQQTEKKVEFTSMLDQHNACAVCGEPGPKRCSRCKAVHYCSSECQTKHWNQGHKLECRSVTTPTQGALKNANIFSNAFETSKKNPILLKASSSGVLLASSNGTSDGILPKPTKLTMESSKRVETSQKTMQQISKRSKSKKKNTVSIEELHSYKGGNIFEGDVIVVYKTTLDKQNNTKVLRADLTDEKGEMTITVNIIGLLVKQHESKIVPATAICITNFQIAPKTDYDRGDCDCILIFTNTTTVEVIPRMHDEYKFIPTSTIRQLLTSEENYAIGSVGALVVGTKRTTFQFVVEIKDGHSEMDKAQVQIHESLEHHFSSMEEQIHLQQYPIMLLRNIVKRQESKYNTLQTTQSTYISKLNNKRASEYLNNLLHSTIEVHGTIRIGNAFSNPFQAFCLNCNYKFDTYGELQEQTAFCIKCKQQVPYIYSHYLKVILTSDRKKTMECAMDRSVIQLLLPELLNISYEEYIDDKSSIVFILRDFCKIGHFKLNPNNLITNAQCIEE